MTSFPSSIVTLTFTVLFQPCSSPPPSAIPSERSSLENAQTGKGCSGFLPLHEHPYPRLLSLTVESVFPFHLLLDLVLTANPSTNSLHSSGSSNLLELAPFFSSKVSRRRIHSLACLPDLPINLCLTAPARPLSWVADLLAVEPNSDGNKFTLKT